MINVQKLAKSGSDLLSSNHSNTTQLAATSAISRDAILSFASTSSRSSYRIRFYRTHSLSSLTSTRFRYTSNHFATPHLRQINLTQGYPAPEQHQLLKRHYHQQNGLPNNAFRKCFRQHQPALARRSTRRRPWRLQLGGHDHMLATVERHDTERAMIGKIISSSLSSVRRH